MKRTHAGSLGSPGETTAIAGMLRSEPHTVATLLRLSSETDADAEHAAQLLARIVWSRLAEPGDAVAGALIEALGPIMAFEALVRGVSAKRLCAELNEHGHELSQRALQEGLGRWAPRIEQQHTRNDLSAALAAQLQLVLPNSAAWPEKLNDLGLHRPIMLWVRGDVSQLRSPALSVVGSRAASSYGSHVTAELTGGVCAAGLTIVSGGAYGIDAVAHRTALAFGAPTIAVVAGGANRIYPRSHSSLFERVKDAGAICAEMVPGSAPTKWRFLQRNRLIAALSQATLVTEAGIRSGSLNTASHAAQLSRSVGAVPGPITSSTSAGCHKLIREYLATAITSVQEACELAGASDELALFEDESSEAGGEGPDRGSAWHRRVFDALPLRGSRDAREVARAAGLTFEQARGTLVELELLGQVQRRDSPEAGAQQWQLRRG